MYIFNNVRLDLVTIIFSTFCSLYQKVHYIKSDLESNSEENKAENVHYTEIFTVSSLHYIKSQLYYQ